jgi:hypothetical protein
MAELFLLTPEEAGREFTPPLSGARIRQLVDSGELQAHRTAAGWRLIERSEVQRLMDKRRAAASHTAV